MVAYVKTDRNSKIHTSLKVPDKEEVYQLVVVKVANPFMKLSNNIEERGMSINEEEIDFTTRFSLIVD